MTEAKFFGKYPVTALYKEVNRLRARDGHEEVGGLAFYLKVHSHFHGDENPRVREALDNLDRRIVADQGAQ